MTVDNAFYSFVILALFLLTTMLASLTWRAYFTSRRPDDAGTVDTTIALWLHDLRKQRSRAGTLKTSLALLILVLAFQIFDRILPAIDTRSSTAAIQEPEIRRLQSRNFQNSTIADPIVLDPIITKDYLIFETLLEKQIATYQSCIADPQVCGPSSPESAQRQLDRLTQQAAIGVNTATKTANMDAAQTLANTNLEITKSEIEKQQNTESAEKELKILSYQESRLKDENQCALWDAMFKTIARGFALFASMFFFGTSLRMYRQTDDKISELTELSLAMNFAEIKNIEIAKVRSDLRLKEFDNRIEPNSLELSFAKAIESAAIKVAGVVKTK